MICSVWISIPLALERAFVFFFVPLLILVLFDLGGYGINDSDEINLSYSFSYLHFVSQTVLCSSVPSIWRDANEVE